MSRDFTPRDIYMVTKQHPDLYLGNITWTLANGQSFNMWTEEEQEVRKKYPVFASLFVDGFMPFYHWLSGDKSTIMSRLEVIICNMAERDYEQRNISIFPYPMVQWYLGKLDPNYYYHEENDRRFTEWLKTWVTGTEFPTFSV